MKKLYGGWLYCNRNEIEKLKEMGVEGPMIWTYDEGPITKALEKDGILERCVCDRETMHKLEKEYKEQWAAKYPHYDKVDTEYPRDHFSEITAQEIHKLWNYQVK